MKGHLIPDNFGGPASPENIVAQTGEINQGKIAKVENIVRELKKDDKVKVDYEIKVNYENSRAKRPSSFEPKITVDGKEYTELPNELKKIYNETAKDLTSSKKVKIEVKEKLAVPDEMGVKAGIITAGVSAAVSTADNISAYIDGEISAEEMVEDIVSDTVKDSTESYAREFISTAVSKSMKESSNKLIKSVSSSCAPGALVDFAIDSCDDVIKYASGEIDSTELAYNLGENAAGAVGENIGTAIGATVGSVAGPVGTVAGGVVGGVVGYTVATEAYKTAVELDAEDVEQLANKAQELANSVIDTVATNVPEALDSVKGAFNEFAESVKLPFVG